MIGYIRGTIIHVGIIELIVRCGDIGYMVYPVGCTAMQDQEVIFWIHDLVREDRRDLYAFSDLQTKLFFEQLISIDGVGHKLAQKILNHIDAQTLRQRILEGDIGFLTSLSGIGKKTAQKIILELKGVLVDDHVAHASVSEEVIDALRSLGYSSQDIKPYLADLPNDTERALKEVLRRLSK